MNHIPPKGWVVYGGADGFDAIPDAAGYLWWGDNMWIDGRKDETFQFILCRQKNNVSEIIPLPERLDGAGRLNWTPAGLTVSVSDNGINKSFQIAQYAQYRDATSVIVQIPTVPTAIFDAQARTDASQALQEARTATKAITALKDTLATVQAGIAKLMTRDATWKLINDRLFGLIGAIETGNRADSLDARWMDVLFKKVNDWIFGWMKDHNK